MHCEYISQFRNRVFLNKVETRKDRPGNSLGHLLVFAGLFLINILIAVIGSPILIYQKFKHR